MAIDTHSASAFCLTSLGASWVLTNVIPEPTESGFDNLTATYMSRQAPSFTGADAADDFALGAVTVSGRNFWTVGVKPKQLGHGFWSCDVIGKGWLNTKAIKVSGGTTVIQQQAENVVVGTYGLIPRFSGLEIAPSVNIEYIVNGDPPTADVGLAGTPDFAPSVRASSWASIADPLQTFPFGWVLVDLQYDRLPGTSITLVRETWAYIFRYAP
jgi:hypothetical protein